MGGSIETLLRESSIGLVCIASAVAGFKWTLWFTAAGIVKESGSDMQSGRQNSHIVHCVVLFCDRASDDVIVAADAIPAALPHRRAEKLCFSESVPQKTRGYAAARGIASDIFLEQHGEA